MYERRHNWKENLGQAARQLAERRKMLMVEYEMNRRDIQIVNVKSNEYKKLMLKQAELIAQLATL